MSYINLGFCVSICLVLGPGGGVGRLGSDRGYRSRTTKRTLVNDYRTTIEGTLDSSRTWDKMYVNRKTGKVHRASKLSKTK